MNEPKWRRYLRFWGSDVKADTDDELRFHLESRARDLVAAGLPPDEARAEAARRFGDVEQVRERVEAIDLDAAHVRKRQDMWDGLGQDLRYALRALRRSPGFNFVAGLTLALGIGASAAIFSVVNAVLLRPLPYHEPDRLVRLFTAFNGQGTERYAMSQPEFMDYRALTQVFEGAAAIRGSSLTLTGKGEPERLRGLAATRDLLPVLGIAPLRGRNFESDEGRTGTEPVVILSHDLWTRRFAGDPALVGRSIVLNGISRRVVGILPELQVFNRAEAIVPMYINPDSMTGRSSNYLDGVARLRPGVSVADAQRALDVLTRRTSVEFARNYPPAMGYGASVVAVRDEMVGDARPALLVLLGAVTLVLLMACANVANLLLARGSARQREIAVRIALGAGRRRVLQQLLTETSVLALASGIIGTLVAWWGVKALIAVNPTAIPRADDVRIDATVALTTLLVTVIAGLLLGLAPALSLVRAGLPANLKEGGRGGSAGREHHRLGRLLVAGEMALAVVVVIGAALLIKSYQTLWSTDPGFRPERVLVVDLSVPESRYDIPATTTFYQRLVERAAGLPGVAVAAAASDLPPVAGGNNWDIQIDGRTTPPGEADPSPNIRMVTGDYFRALSIHAVKGRALEPGDTQGAPTVAVINETFARTFWPATNPVGQRVRFTKNLPWMTIVGVVRDVRSNGLAQSPPAELFVPHEQLPTSVKGTERAMYLTIRTHATDPMTLAAPARRLVRELDPLLAITSIRSMPELMDRSVAQPRFTMLLLGIFGAVALVLAAIGIYGLLSFAVKRRTREIGIRMALGGAPRDVLWMVIGQGMRLSLLGLLVGVAGALAATRLMRGLLYGVHPTDPATFVSIVALLGGVALIASWVPARRAVATDPRAALTAE
ncbi:MAG: ABC transporter permease [Cytophagaceae bacterium]|nr:ABC transporter permease [Gemmatimonadaceae bacterium]